MKKFPTILLVLVGCVVFSSCSVNYMYTSTLRENYENKINKTSLIGRVVFKRDKMKKDTYDHVGVFLNEQEVGRDFEVVAYGSFTPLIFPVIFPERPRLKKRLLWKAARNARKLGADGAIIDSKNDFRVIKYK